MPPLQQIVDCFREICVDRENETMNHVSATLRWDPLRQDTKTGLALDGSFSMELYYGGAEESVSAATFHSNGGRKTRRENQITPIAQFLCSYLGRRIDQSVGTTCIYWATGPGGGDIEVIGDISAHEADKQIFGPPNDYGTGTQLHPAVSYFVERFADSPWGYYVFITDGEISDLEQVKDLSRSLAADIAANRRNPFKLVLIGVGPEVDEFQLAELRQSTAGAEVDLWECSFVAEFGALSKEFANVVDLSARVADQARILDTEANVVKDYSKTGLPSRFDFVVPASEEFFVLEVDGRRIRQSLND